MTEDVESDPKSAHGFRKSWKGKGGIHTRETKYEGRGEREMKVYELQEEESGSNGELTNARYCALQRLY